MQTRTSLRFFLAGLAIIAAYALFAQPGLTQWISYVAIGAICVTAMIIGIHRNAPRRFGPWRATAIGLSLFAVGDLCYGYYANVLHREAPLASVADIFYLGGYVFFAIACARFVRTLGGHDRDALLDRRA